MLNEVKLPPSGEWLTGFTGWCFLRVRQGHGYWLGANEVVEAAEGDVLVITPKREGTFRASRLGDLTLHYFLFCPELLSGLLTLSELQQLETAKARRKSTVRRLLPGDAVADEYGKLEEQNGASNDLLRRSQMLQVAARFFAREWRKPRLSNKTFLPAHKRIEMLMHQLTEAEILDHSVTELAARCNCSPRHFNRLFIQNVGVSFRAKQAELRMLKAQQMLAETDEKIMTVALAVGYRNPGLFNSTFKKQFGMSPSEWRQQKPSAEGSDVHVVSGSTGVR